MRKKQKIINLYEDKNIDSIKVVFSIGCEDDLNQCWDYFECHFRNENTVLQTYLTALYNMSNELIESNEETFFEVIVEQNERYYYFTIWNEIVSEIFAQVLLDKKINFINDAVRITARIEKIIEASSCRLVFEDETQEQLNTTLKEKVEQSVMGLNEGSSEEKSLHEQINIAPYTFVRDDDLEEIIELCDDMVDTVCTTDGQFNENSYIKLRSLISSFSLIISYYEELENISNIMRELTTLISASQERIVAMSADEVALLEGFVNNLDRWVQTVFIKGGADLHFMDASLQADFETIRMIIEPEEVSSEEDIDDIFDF